MTLRQAYVVNGYGIHCRPTTAIVKEAQTYDADIRIIADGGREANAKSSLALLGLGILYGETVTIEVDGEDAEAVCDRMVELFQTDWDFQR